MLKFLTLGIGQIFRSRSKRAAAGKGAGAENREMGFFEHIEELRSMLLRCLCAFTAAVVLAFVYSREIFDLMRHPLRQALKNAPPAAATETAANADPAALVHSLVSILLNGELPAATATAPLTNAQTAIATAHTVGQGMVVLKFMDVFSILLNIGLVGGLALSSGFILYFVSHFVGPALTPSEKRCVVPFCVAAMLLFFGGCAFSFLFLIPVSIRVMFHFVEMFNLTMPWVASDYYGFVTMMTLLVGLTFQFPLVVVILQYLEIVKTSTLFRVWRHVLVGILVGSLVISPLGDPVSLSVLTGVLFLLYVSAASIGGILVRGKIRRREAEEAEYERTYGKPHPEKIARETPPQDQPADPADTSSYDTENYEPENYEPPYDSGDGDGTDDDAGGGGGGGSDGYTDYNEPYDDSQDGLARDDTAAGGEDLSGNGADGEGATAAKSNGTSAEPLDNADNAAAAQSGTGGSPVFPQPAAPSQPDAATAPADNPAPAARNTGEPPVPLPNAAPTPAAPATTAPIATTRLGRQSDLDLIEE